MRLFAFLLAGSLLCSQAIAQSKPPAWKIDFANKVLQQIGATYGYDVLDLPKLVMYPRPQNPQKKNNRIAYLELVSNTVPRTPISLDRSRLLMDEELFDVCHKLDSNGTALAFVLAHEMAHFYLQHATFRSFAERNGGTMSATKSRQQETDADQTGFLFAYLAGYDPEPLLDELFERLYRQYKLEDPLPGHPSRVERLKATKLRTSEFRTYGYLFAVGHALYCRENFAEAARCFEYVYSRYPLKEAFNNFGVCRLQEVVRLKKKNKLSYFALPFEVDPRNRLLQQDMRGESANEGQMASLLTEANTAFGRALKMDPSYQPSYLNQTMGYLLADNPYLALGVLEQLNGQKGRLVSPNAFLLRGIAYCALGDFAKAAPDFTVAMQRKAYQATYNARIFKSVAQRAATPVVRPWQHLQAQKPTLASLHCQATALPLQELEVDEIPRNLKFGTLLIEQNSPLPFIIVGYEAIGPKIYFQAKLAPQGRPIDLYFVRPNAISSPKPARSH